MGFRRRIGSVEIGIFMAIITALCWAVLAIVLKKALGFASSGTIVWLRIIISWFTVSIGFLVFNFAKLKKTKAIAVKSSLAGVFIAINYFGFMKCIEYTSASNAQVFIQLAPLGLALSGIFLFGERLRKLQIVGVIVTVLGFVIFGQGQTFEHPMTDPHTLIGQGWILVAASTWVVYGIFQKQLLLNWSVNQINWWVYLASAIVLAPLATFSEIPHFTFSEWLIILSLAANTLVAYTALSFALKLAPATIVSTIIVLNPILTLVLMWFINQMGNPYVRPEPITPSGYAGAVLVVIGVALVLFKKGRERVGKPA